MAERPVTFQSEGEQVVGILHTPDGARVPFPAVLFFHGFTGSKQESHRMFVTTARRLAERGIASLRFDFRGSGDSAGVFSDVTLRGEVADAKAALRWLRGADGVDASRVVLVGMSMGGLVASYVLGSDAAIGRAVLWCPVAHPAALAATSTEEQKKDLAAGRPADYGGWAVGLGFVQDLMSFKPLDEVVKSRAAILVLHGDSDESVPHGDGESYAKALKAAGREVEFRTIRGADHTFTSLKWEKELIDRTVEWLAKNWQAGSGF